MHAPTAPDLKTMTEVLKKLNADGYKEEFTVSDNLLKSLTTGKQYTPEDVTINNFFRFEGQSDPGDNSILYAIETKDKTKGTLVDAYGAGADPDKTGFMLDVERIQKKIGEKK
ncbi:hypothetical protein GWC95_11360 [Sediminibacterium roseum]|uniref:Phosphoribosylpyrophosphate synthetase n=1 Tax=Sediminibacterium roseum TaxID=1978412 RepID=A0ABW9ZWB9_9BACT|nr:hypothetical protein [Sediminibacterium roseum]NCI50524.1 hypothetical protein [Sediminibacterium roseum]